MSSKAPTGGPRHMARAGRAQHEADPRHRAPAHLAHHDEVDLAEVPPVARVHRSRLAFAVSATLAALPILVLDNLPATADPTPDVRVESTAGAAAMERDPSTTSTLDRSTTSTTAVAPPTTAAPTTSEATSTSASSTSEAPQIATLAAPAPTEPPTTAPPTTAPPPPPTNEYEYGDPNDPATWDRLAQCESGGNWQANSGNGYYGGLQFSLDTWRHVGGEGYPHEHSREEQIHRGQLLQARYGWGQWPTCADRLGYR